HRLREIQAPPGAGLLHAVEAFPGKQEVRRRIAPAAARRHPGVVCRDIDRFSARQQLQAAQIQVGLSVLLEFEQHGSDARAHPYAQIIHCRPTEEPGGREQLAPSVALTRPVGGIRAHASALGGTSIPRTWHTNESTAFRWFPSRARAMPMATPSTEFSTSKP